MFWWEKKRRVRKGQDLYILFSVSLPNSLCNSSCTSSSLIPSAFLLWNWRHTLLIFVLCLVVVVIVSDCVSCPFVCFMRLLSDHPSSAWLCFFPVLSRKTTGSLSHCLLYWSSQETGDETDREGWEDCQRKKGDCDTCLTRNGRVWVDWRHHFVLKAFFDCHSLFSSKGHSVFAIQLLNCKTSASTPSSRSLFRIFFLFSLFSYLSQEKGHFSDEKES